MKRLLVAVGVSALVLTACGAGASSAAQTQKTSVDRTVGVPAVAKARKLAAVRKARKLLREFALPAGAEPLRPGSASHGLLSQSGLPTPGFGKLAQRHGFWQVPRSLSSLLAWVKRHPAPGLKLRSESTVPGARRKTVLQFSFHKRLLAVTLVRLPGRTAVRVDAGAVWIYPRSPEEVLPAGVTTIDIGSERATTHVTDSQKVAQIVSWFDALPIVQPGVIVVCPLGPVGLPVKFDFRSAGGDLLARALAPSIGPSTQCAPVTFTIDGQKQTPLIGGNFVPRVEGLLGVRFAASQVP